jgi:TolB protein
VITATSEGKRATMSLEVHLPVTRIDLSPSDTTIGTGDEVRMVATLRDARGQLVTDRVAAWSSSDPSVATVDATGGVVALTPGSTTITASADGKKATAVLTVLFKLTPVELAFTVQPASTGVGLVMTPMIEVTVRNQRGQPATDYDGEVRLTLGSNPGNAELLGTASVNARAGVATFTNVRVSQEGDAYTLVASARKLAKVSAAFDVAPEAASQIAFSRATDGGSQIYVMNPDGTAVRQLTRGPSYHVDPSWSADGERLAVVRYNGTEFGQIFIMNADGSNPTQLTREPIGANRPSWSPDGTRIAFTRFTPAGGTEVCIVKVDGSDLTPIGVAEFGVDYSGPTWSADGLQIAFAGTNYAWSSLYLANADGSGVQAVRYQEPFYYDVWAPTWSPDGGRILMWSQWAGRGFTLINTDGSGARKLSLASRDYRRGVWSAQGSRIVFERGSLNDGISDLYIAKANGSGIIRLTTDGKSSDAAWRPRPNSAPAAGRQSSRSAVNTSTRIASRAGK